MLNKRMTNWPCIVILNAVKNLGVMQGEILRHLVPQNDKIALHCHAECFFVILNEVKNLAFPVILNASASLSTGSVKT